MFTLFNFASYFLFDMHRYVESNPGPYQNVNLKLAHLNVCSLNAVNKFEEIASIVLNQKYDIFALSKTWLNDSIPSNLFSIPGYYPLIRLDRSDGRQAEGVAVYVTSAISVKCQNDLESSDFELRWVELKAGSHNLFCGICYMDQPAVIPMPILFSLRICSPVWIKLILLNLTHLLFLLVISMLIMILQI